MEILLWLVPSALVTLAAMVWAAWAGRAAERAVDREEAVRRLARVLEREDRGPTTVVRTPRERSTGVAVRRTQPSRDQRRAS